MTIFGLFFCTSTPFPTWNKHYATNTKRQYSSHLRSFQSVKASSAALTSVNTREYTKRCFLIQNMPYVSVACAILECSHHENRFSAVMLRPRFFYQHQRSHWLRLLWKRGVRMWRNGRSTAAPFHKLCRMLQQTPISHSMRRIYYSCSSTVFWLRCLPLNI